MKINYSIAILCFVLCLGSTSAARIARQVIGGKDADITDHPYMVSIRNKGAHVCGGAIISNKHVITAAHCITRESSYADMTLHTGTSTLTDVGKLHKIAKVTVHPQWTGTMETARSNDIAVITVQGTIQFDNKQKKLNLPNHNVVDDLKSVLAGWGCTSLAPNNPHSNHLQVVEMKTMTIAKCSPILKMKLFDNQMCAYQTPGHGSCFGDSGGPLVIGDQIIGIVSWVKCANCGSGIPEVFTNIFAQKAFIESATKN